MFIADDQYLLSGDHTPGHAPPHGLYHLIITMSTEVDALIKPALIPEIADDI